MTRRLADERGVTLIELVIVCLILGFVMDGLANLLVSGVRASAVTQGQVLAQQNAGQAISRLEYEVRCASGYQLTNSGAGLNLTMPTQCSHATGTISWCVSSGVLSRYSAANCAGGDEQYVNAVTSSKPFAIIANAGDLPEVSVQLTFDSSGLANTGFGVNDLITLRNASVVA